MQIDKYNVAIDNHIKVNDYFIFMLTDKDDFLIFDNKTGKKLSTRKKITEENPLLLDFNREVVEYHSNIVESAMYQFFVFFYFQSEKK